MFQHKINSWWERISLFVERELVLPKLFYFMLNVFIYTTYTFTAKYLEVIWRIPSHQFGYIIGLCTLSITGSLFWTIIADRTGRHKLIILLSTVGHTASFSLLRTSMFRHSSDNVRVLFVATCFGLSNFFTSALFPLLDNRVLVMLSTDSRFSKGLFGRQRLFGVFGQSFITIINGYSIGKFGFDAIFTNLILFSIIFAFLIIIGMPVTFTKSRMKEIPDVSTIIEQPQKLSASSVRQLVLSFDYVFFLLIVLIAGTTRGVVGNYLPHYLEKSLNISTLRLSFLLQARVITEIGIFFMGKQLMNWMTIYWLMFFAQVTGFLRVFAYANLPSCYPWALASPAIELLKGINNACLVSAGTRYVHDLAPIGVETTAQGLFSGVHSYLANAVSGFFGGFILQLCSRDPYPFRVLFNYTSVLSGVGIILYSLRCLLFTLPTTNINVQVQKCTST